MFAPTALTTPTRLPWWWPLLIGWLLLTLWAPVFAQERHGTHASDEAHGSEPWRLGGWQFVGTDTMRRALLRRDDTPTPRMLPLAVLPAQRSAWWLGLSSARSAGAQVELRWTMPLDGRTPWRARDDD